MNTKSFKVYSMLTLISIAMLVLVGETIKNNIISALSIGIAIGYLLFGISYTLFSKQHMTNSINNANNNK